jgi:alcohol dehydrogenase class IV
MSRARVRTRLCEGRRRRRRMTNTKASESVSASVLDFAFFSPPTVHFGCGKAADQALPSILSLGKCTLIVTGSSSRWHHLTEAIRNSALLEEAEVFHISPGEPEISDAQNAALAGAELGADSVIGIGGGSAIDVAKAAAGLIPQPQGVHRYLEVVGDGQPLDVPALPLVAVPATAGTGSEATKNGVLESIQHQRKVSIRHSSMVPNVAIVDPTLTLSAPPASTAASGASSLLFFSSSR